LLPVLLAVGLFLLTEEGLELVEDWGGVKARWRAAGISVAIIAGLLHVPVAIGAINRNKKVSVLERRVEELEATLESVARDVFGFADDRLKSAGDMLGFGTYGNGAGYESYAQGTGGAADGPDVKGTTAVLVRTLVLRKLMGPASDDRRALACCAAFISTPIGPARAGALTG
jgi:hypothetical protein